VRVGDARHQSQRHTTALNRSAGDDEPPAAAHLVGKLDREPRLPDTGLTGNEDDGAAAVNRAVGDGNEPRQLALTTDHRHVRRHVRQCARQFRGRDGLSGT
jgi:hypothetical protein